jgi:hypothetical protein
MPDIIDLDSRREKEDKFIELENNQGELVRYKVESFPENFDIERLRLTDAHLWLLNGGKLKIVEE